MVLVLLAEALLLPACSSKSKPASTKTTSGTTSLVTAPVTTEGKGEKPMDPTELIDKFATVYDMRVEDMVAPVGIDNKTPVFSWKTNASTLGWAQTAYQLVVKKGDSIVWDSGKVEDDKSCSIVYAGEALQSSTEYKWNVTVWNHKGEKKESGEETFEMGLLSTKPFSDAKWITYKENLPLDTVFTIDFDFIIDRYNQGFCFSMQDTGTFMMWQVNAYLNDRVWLRPHIKSGGTWTAYPDGPGNMQAIDVTDAIGYSAQDLIGKKVHERIVVENEIVKTYFGPDKDNLTLAATYTHFAPVELKNIGFRHFGGDVYEIARYDNIVVTNKDGEVMFSEDFSSDDVAFVATEAPSVEDGMLKYGGSGKGEEWVLMMSEPTGLPAYRKSVEVKPDLVSAKLYTTALGVYETYINGNRVGRRYDDGRIEYHELKPGHTQPNVRVFYNSYDVTWMLNKGEENVLSSVVTSGWWTGDAVGNKGDKTAYLCKMILTYADGSVETIVTDSTWKTENASPVFVGDIFHGETYDARVDLSYMKPGYDDKDWSPVAIRNSYRGKITAWSGSFITVRDDLELTPQSMKVYKGVTKAASGYHGTVKVVGTYKDGDSIKLNPGETLLIDFGQNFAGWEAFTVEGPEGAVISVEHGEMLNDGNGAVSRGNDGPEGSIYNANYRSAKSLTKYILSGDGKESYHPTFTYHGFRYIEITTDQTVTIHSVRGQVVTSVEKETGWIETSDKDVNQLVSNIIWGMYSNYLSVPTDCPQRDERQGWTADTQVFAKAGSYFGFSKSFLTKFLEDMRDSQFANGNYSTTAPRTRFDEQGTLGWADAGVIVPYYLYMMYGDKTVITEHWASMERFMRYLDTTDNWGGSTVHGDWLAYESNDEQLKKILGVSYYAWVALLMSEMAEVIDKEEAAEKYYNVYLREKEFYQQFVRANGTLMRGEQSVCLYALYLDLLPNEESVQKVIAQLETNLKRNGYRLQTGFLGTAIIMPTLTKIGRSDLAYTLLLQHKNPSWLYSVDQGATTIWERWNSYTLESGFGDVGMNSFNHYAYGAVGSWMFESMAGIDFDPATPGFKRVILAPKPDTRLSVKASYDSAYGMITAETTFEGDEWTYKATLPANTTGEVRIPALDMAKCTVNGKAVSDLTLEIDGIVFVENQNGTLIFEAVAGEFTFVATMGE